MQSEIKIPAINRKRGSLVVVQHATVAQIEPADAHLEKRLAPRAATCLNPGGRDVAAATPIDSDRCLRALHNKLIQRDLPSEERKDTNGYVDTIGMK